MVSPIILILGAGNNIGLHTAALFASQGFRVAVVSRSISANNYPSYLTINADLSDPKSVPKIFATVRESLGEPEVVVYNAGHYPRAGSHLLGMPQETYQYSLQVNLVSAYVAAQEAVASFSTISTPGTKSFLYTGNLLNTSPIPSIWALGSAKSAMAHIIISAASSYEGKDYNFHYVDERTAEGGPMGNLVGGQVHAEMFLELHQKKIERPIVTFVAGKGIVDFPY